GTLCTAVLQSSSATTVMVIGFVSAGLMKLPQAVSVILGANIGTTITAQLIAFKIGDYAWIFVFVGFVMYFFIKHKEKVNQIGQVIFAFGLLFVGINTMGDVMKPLAAAPFFTELMLHVQDVPVLGVAIGTLMTVVIQSSSATIAVLQNLASTAGPDGVADFVWRQHWNNHYGFACFNWCISKCQENRPCSCGI
ncbi:MAG: Na/Pi symporter, partial [Anaerovoracaceae bacterium]